MASAESTRAGGGWLDPVPWTVGFGTAVAMWGVGYVARLPAVLLPSPLVLALLLVCPLAGGFVLARTAGRGSGSGALAGALTGLLNLLVLGSFVVGDGPGRFVPSAALWVPGSILVAAALAAGGAHAGARRTVRALPDAAWPSAFAWVAVAATALLLGVGGLVTSTGTGLAVVDWPNSYGYNMFLYPFSRMTGGIYYEHAHRLFGALVGVTTVALAAILQRHDSRRTVHALAWLAVALVVLQGVLGGLRVTGRFTLDQTVEAMRPSLGLAMTHGVLAQVFFSLLVGLATVSSPAWRGPGGGRFASADRFVGGLLLAAMLGQLVLGAALRHFSELLLVHVAVGLMLVAPMAIHVGFRAWGTAGQPGPASRRGLALGVGAALQVALGLLAWAALGAAEAGAIPVALEVLATTLHQWFGAILLALAVSLHCWAWRAPGRGA